jgi:hypothetical protein
MLQGKTMVCLGGWLSVVLYGGVHTWAGFCVCVCGPFASLSLWVYDNCSSKEVFLGVTTCSPNHGPFPSREEAAWAADVYEVPQCGVVVAHTF